MRRAKKITAFAVAAAMVFSNVAYAAPGTTTSSVTSESGAESEESLNSQSGASEGTGDQASDQAGNDTDTSAQSQKQTESKTDEQNTAADAGETKAQTSSKETTKNDASSETTSTDAKTQETPSKDAEAQKSNETAEASKTEEEKVLYDITFETPEKHGKVTDVNGKEVTDGKTLKTDENGKVQFKVKADDGYQVSAVYQMPDEKTPLKLVKDSYYELQVDKNTTVKVVYQKIPEEKKDGEDADSDADEVKEEAGKQEQQSETTTKQESAKDQTSETKPSSEEKDNTKDASSKTTEDQKKKSAIAKWFSKEPNNGISTYQEDDSATGQTYFEVCFEDEEGKLIWKPQYVLSGTSTTAPILSWENVTESGKHFVGWQSSQDNEIYTSAQICEKPVTADVTYTAVFKTNEKYEVRVEYVYANQEGEIIGQAAQPFVAEVDFGEPYQKTITSPTVSGFTPDNNTVSIDLEEGREEDYLVTVKYTGEPKEYTVIHQLENLEGDEYKNQETETLTGTIGLKTNATAKNYPGFTAQPVENVTLQNDGETTIYIKYTRNSYVLTYNSDGGTYVSPVTLKYGAEIPYPGKDTMKRVGFEFAGWEQEDQYQTMPASDLTVKAIWTNATRASYTVVYWLENFTGEDGLEGYDYITSKTQVGDVGDSTYYSKLTSQEWKDANIDPAGVELNNETTNVEIKADGSAVVNVLYNRKEFTIQFYETEYHWGIWSGYYEAKDEIKELRITAKYGESIIRKWSDDEHTQSAWCTEANGTTYYTMLAYMPAENIKVYQRSRDTGGTITWYIEDLNGQQQKYMSINTSMSSQLSDEDKSPIEGFTFDSWQKTGRNKWLYYTRNSYSISFENASGINDKDVKYEASLSSAKPRDNEVRPPEGIDSDSKFGGWYYSPTCESSTEVKWDSDKMPAHNVRVYAKWIPAEYTLSFETNGAGKIPSQTLKKHTQITLPEDPTKAGYTFLGWYLDSDFKQPFTEGFQILEDTTLYAKWAKENETYQYTVQYVDSDSKELISGVDPETMEGEKDSTITIYAKDLDGWYPVVSSKNVTLSKNGMIIQMEYKKAETWKYTIKYVESNSEPEKEIKEAVEKTSSSSRVVEYAPNIKGYVPDYENNGGVFKSVTKPEDGSDSVVITFYYKPIPKSKYTIEYLDEEGNKIHESASKEAEVGEYVTVKDTDVPIIKGYKLAKKSSSEVL